ncbi:MAG: hypothetical protein K4H23_04800, partial [Mollicutes bacterium PWAP]|nr:hypothetical protein [Mollicutes bacterium PWAP]
KIHSVNGLFKDETILEPIYIAHSISFNASLIHKMVQKYNQKNKILFFWLYLNNYFFFSSINFHNSFADV